MPAASSSLSPVPAAITVPISTDQLSSTGPGRPRGLPTNRRKQKGVSSNSDHPLFVSPLENHVVNIASTVELPVADEGIDSQNDQAVHVYTDDINRSSINMASDINKQRYVCEHCLKSISMRTKHSLAACQRLAKKRLAEGSVTEANVVPVSEDVSGVPVHSFVPEVSAAASFAAIAQLSPTSSPGTALQTLASLSTAGLAASNSSSSFAAAMVGISGVVVTSNSSPLKKRKVTGFGDMVSTAVPVNENTTSNSTSILDVMSGDSSSLAAMASASSLYHVANENNSNRGIPFTTTERRRPEKPRTVCPRCQKDVSMRTRHPASACYKHARKLNITITDDEHNDDADCDVNITQSSTDFAVECGSLSAVLSGVQTAQFPADQESDTTQDVTIGKTVKSDHGQPHSDLLMLSTAAVTTPAPTPTVFSPHSTLVSRLSGLKHQIECPECHKMISYRTRHPESACIKYTKKMKLSHTVGVVGGDSIDMDSSSLVIDENGAAVATDSVALESSIESQVVPSSAIDVSANVNASEGGMHVVGVTDEANNGNDVNSSGSSGSSGGNAGILQRCMNYFNNSVDKTTK